MSDPRHPLEPALGYSFKDSKILLEALTHRGATGGGNASSPANERLEFLGDRVLGLVIAETLLKEFPREDEGALATRLAALVSAPVCGRIAHGLGLADHVKMAPGQRADDEHTAVLADACEAVIGALYLDGGLEAARAFIAARWAGHIHADLAPPKDAKTSLQEWAQARGLPLPAYRVVRETGPAHAPAFVMAVSIEGHAEKIGEGRTKRLATQEAAAALLATLEKR
ncbi:MAG: ribonuclease III [Rhodospirillaceae bacterium]|nr:ribonuclease III [Rhodospirillaceae bacterium]